MLIGNDTSNAISLVKGAEVSLAKAAVESGTTLSEVTVGLGWDRQSEPGEAEFDADSVALVLDKDEKIIPGLMPVIFYNNLVNENGSIVHSKDNRTGDGAGYDETIKIKFGQLDPRVEKLVIGLTIHGAPDSGQNFGQIDNAVADVIDDATGKVAVNINLTKNLSEATALDAVLFTKEADGTWSCKYVGKKVVGFEGLLQKYGITYTK